MKPSDTKSRFAAELRRPADPGSDASWAFVVLPEDASAKLPRRGRTTVVGTVNGHDFQATLEPDGQLSHWLRVDQALLEAAGADFGDVVEIEVVDWIHWITSAKQPKTRAKRIGDACAKLASGERRVCCFDSSGHYSKSLSAPKAR